MIQRIQTVYLALTAISLLAMLSLDFYEITAQNETSEMLSITATAFGGEVQIGNTPSTEVQSFVSSFNNRLRGMAGPHLAYLSLILIASILSIFTIFLFNKRKNQLKVGRINLLFILALFTVLGFSTYLGKGELMNLANKEALKFSAIEVVYHIGMFLPVLALAFQFMANINVKRDEKLVKSLDRLR